MSSKDCLIVSALYCLARGMQSNDLPPTHRGTHSFHPGPYFTRLQCEHECVCVCVGVFCKHSCVIMCLCMFAASLKQTLVVYILYTP